MIEDTLTALSLGASDLTKITDQENLVGSGVFDALMTTVSQHLAREYNEDRLTGSDYANVYAQSIASVMSISAQYLINASQLNKQSELTNEQIYLVQKQQTQIDKQNAIIDQQLVNLQQEVQNLKAQETKISKDSALIEQQILNMQQEVVNLQSQKIKIDKDALLTDEQILSVQQDVLVQKAQISKLAKDEALTDEQILRIQEEVKNIEQQGKNLEQQEHQLKEARLIEWSKVHGNLMTYNEVDQMVEATDSEGNAIPLGGLVGSELAQRQSQTDVLVQKLYTERAQTDDTHYQWDTATQAYQVVPDSATFKGVLGRQYNVLDQQGKGFQHDYRTKAARTMLEMYSVSGNIDDGMPPVFSYSTTTALKDGTYDRYIQSMLLDAGLQGDGTKPDS